ncbi:MAG TPA: HAMP domain-containing sensor histidine kinase [Anaeromyxobacteraceae bacterium]|nr:HAMP domain-containing sensor histidine kinase [Anaeromyxobacteraceae bacterium]
MPRLRIPPPPPIGPVAGSVLAMAFVMLALLLQLVLGPILYTGPYFAFLGAVFVSAWLGGFPGGLLASALSAVLVNVFFIEPRGTFSASHSALMTTGIFVGAAIVVTFLSAALQAGYRERVHVQSEALRARDDFLSVASHELRTPIMLAQLQVQRLRRQLRRGEADRVRLLAQVESTEASIVRLGALVDALLDVSRVASGSLVAKRVPVDLSETVSEAAGRLVQAARLHGSELRLEVAPGVRGMADRLRIEQVVTNLVANAIRYGKGSPIVVRLGRDGERAVLTVSDRGIGIAAGDLARIFDRFERASSSRQYGGLGLGLWISREIVRASGGSIAVESTPGEGATFKVELPLPAPSSAA